MICLLLAPSGKVAVEGSAAAAHVDAELQKLFHKIGWSEDQLSPHAGQDWQFQRRKNKKARQWLGYATPARGYDTPVRGDVTPARGYVPRLEVMYPGQRLCQSDRIQQDRPERCVGQLSCCTAMTEPRDRCFLAVYGLTAESTNKAVMPCIGFGCQMHTLSTRKWTLV